MLIVTLPAPVAEMFADKRKSTALPFIPVPHEMPLSVIEPVLVVTLAWYTSIPRVEVPPVPVPVIVTLPPSVAEMFVPVPKETPRDSDPVAQEVPLTVIDPKLVVMQDLRIIPVAHPVPLAAVPVIIISPEYVET